MVVIVMDDGIGGAECGVRSVECGWSMAGSRSTKMAGREVVRYPSKSKHQTM